MKDRKKFMRRLAGILQTRLPEIGLDKVKDPRPRDRRRRWRLACILQTILVSMFAGAKSLADCEQSSELMSRSMQRLLGIRGRLPDTTCRDILGWLDVEDLRACIHRMAKHAHRRRATLPQGLPFGVLAMDGKYTCIPKNDEPYSQKKETAGKNPESEMGMVRTITSALVSSAAKICIDVSPIPVKTNEMGHFAKAFTDLVDVYGRRNMFRVITADAGYASEENAQLVVSKGYDFLFRLNTFQPTLLREAQDQLAHVSVAVAQTQDGCKPGVVIRRLYLTEEMAGFEWEHLRTVLRVEVEKVHLQTGEVMPMSEEDRNRYTLSSLPVTALTPAQWLWLVRSHWAVENNCHHTFDTVFKEDLRPWILKDPQGMVVVLILRRLAYNVMALFRSVTQRSEDKRNMPWKCLQTLMVAVMMAVQESDLTGLRKRKGFAGI